MRTMPQEMQAVADYLTTASQRGATELCSLPVRNRAADFRLATPILCGFSLVLLLTRLAARICGVPSTLGWDDGVIVAAFATALPIAIFSGFMSTFGLGQDIWMVDFVDITNLLRLFYICQILYLVSVTLTKVALILFFLRVFPQRWFKRTCWAVMAIVVLFGLAFAITLFLQCRPLAYNWNSWDGEHTGSCVNLNAGTHINASINMVLDLVILFMPMPILLRLHITYSWKQKAGIIVMFSFGSIVTVVSALRLRTLVNFGNTVNPTWDLTSVGLWSVVEIYVGIMCACLPATRSFLFKVLPRWLGYTVTDSSGPSGPRTGQSAVSRSKTPNVVTRSIVNKGSFSERSNEGFTELDDLDEPYGLPLQGTRSATNPGAQKGPRAAVRETDAQQSGDQQTAPWSVLETDGPANRHGSSPVAVGKAW